MGELVSLDSYRQALGPRRGCRKATSALEWYERALAIESADAAGAMAAYERAIAGRPDFADAYNNLGRLHHDAGAARLAESLYRLAICAGGDGRGGAVFWFNLGVALEDQGRFAEAIAAYEEALARDGALADAHYNLARQLERAAGANELVLRRAVRHLSRYRELARHQPIFK